MEIMVSLLLISLALFSLVAVFPKVAGHRKVIREVDEAQMIASTVLDSLQNYSKINPIISGDTLPSVTRSSVQYAGNYTVDNSVDYLKTAVVYVRWSKNGKDHEVKLAGVVR